MERWQEPLEEAFARFTEFGGLLDRRSRRYLVQYLKAKLFPPAELPPELSDAYSRYFAQALDQILSGNILALCRDHPAVAAEISSGLLDWLRKTHSASQSQDPFEEERSRLRAATVMPFRDFVERWHYLTGFLRRQYAREELDAGFYEAKFEELTGGQTAAALSPERREAIERVFQDLLAQWDARLSARVLQHQIGLFEESREDFQARLESKAQEFRKLISLLAPFAEYAGRYWDLSRELWEDADFDLLRQYQDLLENEASVRQLIDLLGRMREAEILTEEETLDRVIVRQQWIEDLPFRAEITGIHESGDLDSLLSSEVGLMAFPETETAFLKRLAEKELLTFRYEDRQLVTSEHHFTEVSQRVRLKEKGPFIVCVDTSDSMSGEAERIAKVICFAILKMAAAESRRAYLINFSVGIHTLDLFDVGKSLGAVARFLRMSFRGGTDLTLALGEVLRQLQSESYRDADVLIISDFIMYRIEEGLLARIRHFQQKQGVKFHSLTLSEQPNPEVLEQFDSHWAYDPGRGEILRGVLAGLRRG
jgi:uncharacterized protein with von Willebrand factor type A (vWA) domain